MLPQWNEYNKFKEAIRALELCTSLQDVYSRAQPSSGGQTNPARPRISFFLVSYSCMFTCELPFSKKTKKNK